MDYFSNAFNGLLRFTKSQFEAYQDDDVEIEILDEDDLTAPKWSCFRFLSQVVNTISVQIFGTIRKVADLKTRNSAEMAVVHLFDLDHYVTRNPNLMKKLFNYHRNDLLNKGILSNAKTSSILMKVQDDVFKGSLLRQMVPNDSILTCDVDFSKVYRKFLHQSFAQNEIQKNFQEMEKFVDAFLLEFKEADAYLILNQRIKFLATSIMGSLFFGIPNIEASKPLLKSMAEAASKIVPWLTDEVGRSYNIFYEKLVYFYPKFQFIQESEKLKVSKILIDLIDQTIQIAKSKDCSHSLVKKMIEENFSDNQIRSMIFMLFVAGQDNVSTTLTYAIHKLSLDTRLQKKIADEDVPFMESKLIRALISESLRTMCPIGGITRTLGKNICVNFKDKETGSLVSRTVMRKGDAFSGFPIFLAKDPSIFINPHQFSYKRQMNAPSFLPALEHMPFGFGKHVCPGWYLFYAISAMTIKKMAKECYISTNFKGEPKAKAGFVTMLATQIPIKLTSKS